ncbi:MAG TPA: DUF4337 family protein [Gemmataceae bacterium]|jgi:hypothetical protein
MSTAEPAEAPKSARERALAAVPIVLTVLATILAGLSSSEMTQSMYFRSLAAQQQAKAGSQWAFFQAKRVRGTTMESSGDLVRALADPPPLDAGQLRAAADRVEAAVRRAGSSPEVTAAADRVKEAGRRLEQLLGAESARQSLAFLTGPELPAVAENHTHDGQLRSLVQAVAARQTEAQTAAQVATVPPERIEEALEQAEANAAAFDEACKPATTALRQLEEAFAGIASEVRKLRRGLPSGSDNAALDEASRVVRETRTGLRATKQDFTARRYAKEAAYNQESAELFEILVRRNGVEADRHRVRSRNFFYAMLCAQAGVTVASFALARTRKSWFWAVAGMAGVLAVSFGAYVYVAI